MCEPLPDDHVEIEVRAVGLNFRDVLICMGEISDNYLGNECAGVVTKVGAAVRHLQVGDRVNAWCLGSFSTSVRNPADCVERIPDSMSFATAASLPAVYVTAYYGLIYLARLRAGESVLIHAAAGGVGQAAIQFAKMIGAEIFVTVGTMEKKGHLIAAYGIAEDHIFASRDLTFASGIMRVTGGRGVDVVLNSLAGEALKATWRCIALFGRFIEIGKKDIEANSRLDMAPFVNVTLASVDISIILRQNRKLAAELFSE
jgi:NADPH:quinone reductase-like Zn-dependent oxidoreductase